MPSEPMTTYLLVTAEDDEVMYTVAVGGPRVDRQGRALDYFGSVMQDEPSGAEVEQYIADGFYNLISFDGPVHQLEG